MSTSSTQRLRREPSQSSQDSGPSMPLYRYHTLPTKSSIRILEILPSIEELECKLTIVNLDDSPTFDALSYSWANPITIRERPIPSSAEGLADMKSLLSLAHIPTARHPSVLNVDPGALALLSVHDSLPYMDREHGRSRCQNIMCDGLSIPITETLYAALLVLRNIIICKAQAEKDGSAYIDPFPAPQSASIWIDQICIDQANISERNLQVPLMNSIYASAHYVFAWIGDLDPLGLAGIQAVVDRGKGQKSNFEPEHRDMSYARDGLARKEMYVLAALLSRQWFRRAWVVQEAIYAKRMYIWSGNIFVDWWVLMGALETINEREVSNMTNFTSSLIRREPTGQMSKKLARFQGNQSAPSSSVDVTNEEVLGYIQGTLSFMRGVVQIKRQLGLQTFDYTVTNDGKHEDELVDSRFDNLVIGFRGLLAQSPLQTHERPMAMHQQDTGYEIPAPLSVLNSLLNNINRPSRPFSDVSVPIPEVSSKSKWNMSIVHHRYDAAERVEPVPISLFSLITRFRDVGASDPRDKVFAFLHLATEIPGMKPNYLATTQTVFKGAAKLLLNRYNLTVLSHVQDPLDTKVPELPSWVPDFSVPLGRKPFVAHDGSSPYSASGKHSSQPNFSLTISDPELKTTYEVMATSGWFLDTVAGLAAPKGCSLIRIGDLASRTPKFYTKDPSPVYIHKSRIILRLAESPHLPRVEALWRTLIGDYYCDTYPAPVTAGFGFSDWELAHMHHSYHVSDMLKDHFKAVQPEDVNEGLKESYAIQTRKRDIALKLSTDEYGGYLCYDCALEFWNDKMKEYGPMYKKMLETIDFEPEMTPCRYLPDGFRILALIQCSRTIPPRIDPDTEFRCPAFTNAEHDRLKKFENRMQEVKTGRRMFRTKRDLLGMGPKSTQPGDEIWVIMGAKVPFVLRPVDGGKQPIRYTLVGEAYVHGYMDGEILEENKELQVFGLV